MTRNLQVFTGRDVIEIDGKLINDGANGKVVEIRFNNDIANIENGKNGNSIITYIENGNNCVATIRVLVGNETDIYLNGRLEQYKNSPATFVALSGKFSKKVGDGTGNIKKIMYDLQGGVISKVVDSEEDTGGDTEQAVAVYNIKFCRGVRTIS